MIKLVDQLSAMGSFPIATAQDIVCSDNERLQEKIDNGTLGGGGGSTATTLTQEEYDALDPQEQLEGEFYCYDSARHFRNGVEYGKAVDISGKQDDLHKVKFTMRRNSVNEPRYCLIGSSDLTKTLLMNEPYRFDGTFGSNNNIEKSITSFTVSFKEGVGDPSRILRGFTNNAEGFKYVDLLITVDETENLAYAYVDFLQENSLASGEITKPFLDAESYMDFAESFELVDTYKGTLVCKMSDYCKVITEISDEVSDSTVWSSKKTSDEIADIDASLDELESAREIILESAVDLNTLLENGIYIPKSDTIGNNCTNIPTTPAYTFALKVYGGSVKFQEFSCTNGTFKRKHYNGAWRGDWQELATKTVTTLAELGLTSSATVDDVHDKLAVGQMAILQVRAFDNYQTLFPYADSNDQYARIEIQKGKSATHSRIFWWRKDGSKFAVGNINSNNKLAGWNEYALKSYVDSKIADLQAQINALKS